jgi:pimeloyl-ACP methyl ester carboxylesterase
MNWLLLRGLTREARHWGDFPQQLRRAFPASRVLTLDLPGTGTECARTSPWSIAEIADDVRARFLSARRRRGQSAGREQWAVIAVSLGGMVVLDWLGRYPNDFVRAVVVNSSSAEVGRPWQRLSLRQLLGCLVAAVTGTTEQRERRVLEAVTATNGDLAALAPVWAGYAEDRPVTATTGVRQIAAGWRFRRPGWIKVPMLFLSSRGDKLVDPVCTARLARWYAAPLCVHPTAGHELDLDDPAWLIQQVREWVRQLSVPRARQTPGPRIPRTRRPYRAKHPAQGPLSSTGGRA